MLRFWSSDAAKLQSFVAWEPEPRFSFSIMKRLFFQFPFFPSSFVISLNLSVSPLFLYKSFYSFGFWSLWFPCRQCLCWASGLCGMCVAQCWVGQSSKEGPYTGLPVLLLFSVAGGTIGCTTSNRATSLNRRGPQTQGIPSSWPLKQWSRLLLRHTSK